LEELCISHSPSADGANADTDTVAQHLHENFVAINNNNVTCGIERNTRGTLELTGACSIAAYGAVEVAQHFKNMVGTVG
jgi:hypothetical protein